MEEQIYRVQMNDYNAPNFATAELIIRCKNCEYYRTDSAIRQITCIHHLSHVEPNDFCSYGERNR